MNEWISVKDRLPKGECIAVGYQNEMSIGYLGYSDDVGWVCENEGEILNDVTHWQPLPPPPEEI